MITPGSTPKHTFTLPDGVNDIKTIFVSYGQNDVEVFCKKSNEVQLNGNDVIVQLTQEDTLKLECGIVAEIQLKILLEDGNVGYTEIIKEDVAPVVLNREVMS